MKKILSMSFMIGCFIFIPDIAAGGDPFSDLPLGHWAYDAVQDMHAQGLIVGYPDATYRGDRLMTRYETASILARALKNIDGQQASKEQSDLVRRMTLEFKDELKVLGLTVQHIEEESTALTGRLGGWRISGNLRQDATFLGEEENGRSNDDLELSRARLDISRRFGEDEENFFYAQLNHYPESPYVELSKFYVRFNLPWDIRATVGRFSMDFETDKMAYFTGRMGYYGQGAWFTDFNNDGLGFSKAFETGDLDLYFVKRALGSPERNTWDVAARFAWSINEHFSMDIGLDFESIDDDSSAIDTLTTAWVAPKLEITPDIGLRGAVYAQFTDYSEREPDKNADDNPLAWRVVLELKQDLLVYTSLWLEYNHLDKDFVIPGGTESLLLTDREHRDFFLSSRLGGDLSIWRVGLNQVWNERWSSWIYYARYEFSDFPGENGSSISPMMEELSAGVEYRLNQYVTLSLGYFYHKFNEDAMLEKNRILVLRTSIWF